ncbi:hypothetical protein M9434_004471 [Picochlorum sp. BPE23]|nr:hypothetical protein M9434_004471 [Picochlorum sp. BPE23]
MEIIEEFTLQQGLKWYKVLVTSSQSNSKIYLITGDGNTEKQTSWRVDDSFLYERNWNDSCLIEFLTVLIAGKMKEGYRLVGNFVYEYEDSLTELASKRGKRKREQYHKPLKGGTSILELAQFFHLPINEAAKKLDICPTVLKKICRKHGLPRWPHRKLQSIERELVKLQELLGDPSQSKEQMTALDGRIKHLKKEKKSICFQS